VLLILTGSEDGTVHRIVAKSSLPIFRFNIDLFFEYKIEITPTNWRITDPTGRTISSDSATRVFWWKAFSYGLDQEPFLHEEIKYIFREIYSWFGHRNLIIGNPPDTENRIGKIRQLELANKYFQTPDTKLALNVNLDFPKSKDYIVKSLTSGLTTSSKAMFTQEVRPQKLDPALPWYIQEKLESDLDITVLITGEELHSFSRSRKNLTGLDWRAEQFSDKTPWNPFFLENLEIEIIKNYCKDLGVTWGRLDFMKSQNELYFLEINFNGQWAFLDIEDKHGLVAKVVNYLESGETHSFYSQA